MKLYGGQGPVRVTSQARGARRAGAALDDRLPLRAPLGRNQEGGVEQQPAARLRRRRRLAADRLGGAGGQLGEDGVHLGAQTAGELAGGVLLQLLAPQEGGSRALGAPRRGFGGEHVAGAGVVQADPHPPLDPAFHAVEDGFEALAVIPHMGDRPVVGSEKGEQLHRQDGAGAGGVLDDSLVGEGAVGDPGEVGEPALDLGAAVAAPGERRRRSARAPRRRRRPAPAAAADRGVPAERPARSGSEAARTRQ